MTSGRDEEVVVRWRVHPMKDAPTRAALVLAVALACALGAVHYVGDLLLSLPIVIVFLYSLSSFFLPTDYELSREAVCVVTPFRTTRKPWSRFGGYTLKPGIIVLTRLTEPSTLDRLHGIELRLDEATRDRAIDFVKGRFS